MESTDVKDIFHDCEIRLPMKNGPNLPCILVANFDARPWDTSTLSHGSRTLLQWTVTCIAF